MIRSLCGRLAPMLTACLPGTGVVAVLTAVMAPALLGQAGLKPGSFAVGANLGYYILSGRDFDATNDALGVEVYGSMLVSPRVEVVLGGHYGSHGTFVDDNLAITAAFVEPRINFTAARKTRAFLGARLGFVHRTIKPGTTRFSSSGYGLGVVGGIRYPLSGSVELEGIATLDRISLADLFGGSDRDSGSSLGIRAGVRVPLGRS